MKKHFFFPLSKSFFGGRKKPLEAYLLKKGYDPGYSGKLHGFFINKPYQL